MYRSKHDHVVKMLRQSRWAGRERETETETETEMGVGWGERGKRKEKEKRKLYYGSTVVVKWTCVEQ